MPELSDELARLWERGDSAIDISKHLTTISGEYISKNAVVGRAHRTKLTARESILPKNYVRPMPGIDIPPAKRCRWIEGDPLKPSHKVCGKMIKSGSPYCPEHHEICYVPAPPVPEVA